MPEPRVDTVVEDFRQALIDCRELYQSSAAFCLREHPHLVRRPSLEYLELMEDLHRGLVVKIYLGVALIDHRWANEERRLATELLEHAWQERLSGVELRQAVEHLSEQVDKMTWYSLIRPFAEMPPLRDRIAELETVVMRLANIVARADGTFSQTEEHFLRTLQQELEHHLRPLQLDDPSAPRDAHRRATLAMRAMEKEKPRTKRPTRQDASHPERPSQQSRVAAGEKQSELAASPPPSLEELLAELDSLIGLPQVKEEVRTLANLLKLQQHREKSGLPRTPMGLHMVFEGNPGTGKTTVARLVARIFQAMGILQKGHLVETDRSGLVAEYAGQTGPKTNQIVDAALDGVLFIDEAYSIVASEGDDPFGREALQTLLKRMEDDRDRLVVILAGYPQPMRQLLRANPGLSSRFNRTLTFADYPAVDLCCIFERLCRTNHFQLTADVRAKLIVGFQWLFTARDEHFGNGRLVRNVFETVIRRLANRIASSPTVTQAMLTEFSPADLVFPDVPPTVVAADVGELRFHIRCPGCHAQRSLGTTLLGRRVQCSGCGHAFDVHWGELVQNGDANK